MNTQVEGNLLLTVLVPQVLNIFQEPRRIWIARSFFQPDNCHLEGLRGRLLRLPSKPQLEGRGKTGHLEFGMQTHLSFKFVQCVNFYTNLENGGVFFWGITFSFWVFFVCAFAFAFAATVAFASAFASAFACAFAFAAFAFAFAFACAFAFAAFAFAFAFAAFYSFSVLLLLCCIGLSFCFYIYFAVVAAQLRLVSVRRFSCLCCFFLSKVFVSSIKEAPVPFNTRH